MIIMGIIEAMIPEEKKSRRCQFTPVLLATGNHRPLLRESRRQIVEVGEADSWVQIYERSTLERIGKHARKYTK